jgi:hypothetical protein
MYKPKMTVNSRSEFISAIFTFIGSTSHYFDMHLCDSVNLPLHFLRQMSLHLSYNLVLSIIIMRDLNSSILEDKGSYSIR